MGIPVTDLVLGTPRKCLEIVSGHVYAQSLIPIGGRGFV